MSDAPQQHSGSVSGRPTNRPGPRSTAAAVPKTATKREDTFSEGTAVANPFNDGKQHRIPQTYSGRAISVFAHVDQGGLGVWKLWVEESAHTHGEVMFYKDDPILRMAFIHMTLIPQKHVDIDYDITYHTEGKRNVCDTFKDNGPSGEELAAHFDNLAKEGEPTMEAPAADLPAEKSELDEALQRSSITSTDATRKQFFKRVSDTEERYSLPSDLNLAIDVYRHEALKVKSLDDWGGTLDEGVDAHYLHTVDAYPNADRTREDIKALFLNGGLDLTHFYEAVKYPNYAAALSAGNKASDVIGKVKEYIAGFEKATAKANGQSEEKPADAQNNVKQDPPSVPAVNPSDNREVKQGQADPVVESGIVQSAAKTAPQGVMKAKGQPSTAGNPFKPATRDASFLRMALVGPSGSGKTYTALKIATNLVPGGRVAVIDTERGSARKYANLFKFDVVELRNYHPDQYIKAIQAAVANNYDVLVIDSLSHAWNGTGGVLSIVDQKGGRFDAWKDVTPLQLRMVDAMLDANIHLLATMRSKTEYVVEQVEDKGRIRNVPRKVGVAPVQRDGMEYEFDIFAEIDLESTLTISKSRCPELTLAQYPKAGVEVAKALSGWLAA